jgi:hypothetical protein
MLIFVIILIVEIINGGGTHFIALDFVEFMFIVIASFIGYFI